MTKEHRTTELFVPEDTPVGQYFSYHTRTAKNLKNSGLFLQRNVMTAMGKRGDIRTDNEKEVIARLEKIWPQYRKTAIRNLTDTLVHNHNLTEKERMDKTLLMRSLIKRDHPVSPGKWFLHYELLDAIFKQENDENYRALHSHVAQNILSEIAESFQSFFAAIKAYKENPKAFTGRPNLPGYLAKNGRSTITYSSGDVKIVEKGKKRYLSFPCPQSEGRAFVPTIEIGDDFLAGKEKVGEVKVKPVGNGFKVLIDHVIEVPETVKDNGRYLGVDLGLENLVTIASNVEGVRPLIVGGREIKSVNQYFNKMLAQFRSQLPKGTYSSHAIYDLLSKREHQLKGMLNAAAHIVTDYAVAYDISRVVIGKNHRWKDDFKAFKKVKQSFMFVPFNNLIDSIKYACQERGIEVIVCEESYTSQASLIDGDVIPTWDGEHHPEYKFSGKRFKRGLYRAGDGRLLNADVNGAGNILRKWNASAFNGVEDYTYLMNPFKVKILKSGEFSLPGGSDVVGSGRVGPILRSLAS